MQRIRVAAGIEDISVTSPHGYKPGASRSRTPRHDAPGREQELTGSLTSWGGACKRPFIPSPGRAGPSGSEW
jgi:hypothetical protein